MYLQLADNDPYQHLAAAPNELYIFVPAGYKGAEKDLYIREDLLDNLPDANFQQIMFDLEPYQAQGMSAKADRQQRREERKARKATKGGAARRDAKLQRVQARQQGKAARAAAGGGFGGVLDKIGGVVSNIVGGGAPSTRELDINAGQGGVSIDYQGGDEPTFFEQYKTPLIIGGVVLAAGAAYFLINKNKK
jgi:hypothetical protein